MITAHASWKRYRLGDLAQYINGKAFKPEDWERSGLPIIRIQNLTDKTKPFNYCAKRVEDRYLVTNGDLLVSWSATLGSFIWDRGQALLNQHIFKVIPVPTVVDKEFLHYLLLDNLRLLAEHTHGIAMKHITKSKFDNIEVRVPPIPEQRRLVALIRECLDRIDEVETLSSKTEVEVEHLPLAFRYDLWEECSKKHEMVPLRAVTTSTKNGLYKPRQYHGSGRLLLRMFNINGANLDLSRVARMEVTEKEGDDFAIKDGDIVISRVNSRELVGKTALVEGLLESAVHEAMLIRLRTRDDSVDGRFLVSLMNSPQFLHELRRKAKHAIGQSSINQEDLLESKLPLPPLRTQLDRAEEFQQFALLSGALEREISDQDQLTRSLRESALRKAFAGEL
jgi:type I restriction enzyme S subunit